MVDFSVMWIHRRTGPNSGVTYGPFVIGLFVFGLVVLAIYGWPLLLVGIAVAGVFLGLNYRSHQQHRAHGEGLSSCVYCRREVAGFKARERRQREQDEWDRLQNKYRA